MRRNRTKTRSKNKKGSLTIIVLIAALFIGAPLIGFLGTKYILIPKIFNDRESTASGNVSQNTENTTEELRKKIENKISESDNKNNETQQSKEELKEEPVEKKLHNFEIPALSIYSIQVGSFDNREHAQKQVENLNEKGLGGYIVDTDRFRVVTMSFTERSDAEKFKEEIQNHYSDAFISPRELSIRSINYGDEGKKYSEVAGKGLDELKKYYENFSKFLASKEISNSNSNEIIQFIDSEVNRLEKITNTISEVSPSEEFANFNNKITNLVNTSKEKLIKVKESNISDEKQLFEIFMESINSYADIV
ncbi:SPOR domain-containing protein [Maledivibacter halophilus]|uniref:Cell division protein n=1 Tax=Maledivibacter halophilus TaxID=36842 RepID=A0A1T5KKN5_9FIRM|nr:SPOR domain-containing protein [Maledivibacter halophilus]SKC64312.1 Cell division protein [Maledivibacter halophilus]